MKIKSLIFLATISLIAINAKAQSGLYKKAGEIKIKDHKAVMAGTIRDDNEVFTISLEDIGQFDGHICGCNTAGFLITKNVLEKLFPDETPVRNTLNISISEYNRDLIDAITYITGTRLNSFEKDFILDESLAGEKGTTKIIFERKDNRKKIQVVLDKNYLLSQEEMMTIMTIKPKIMKGEATVAEKEKYANVTRAIVNKEITNMPENAISYQVLN